MNYDIQLPPFIVEETVRSFSEERPVSWGVNYLEAPKVWDKTKGGKAVVFVIDTEDDSDHEALAGNLVKEYCRRLTNEPIEVESLGGHGLHVADTVKQIAPDVRIGLIKALTNGGSGFNTWVAGAIRWATDLTLLKEHEGYSKIINLSLGGDSPSPIVKSAIDYAKSKGVTVCAAAGNDAKDVDHPGVDADLAVGAIDEAEKPAPFSSPGPEVDVAAPGVKIYGAYKGAYAALTGTSMASPHVAGVCALLKSYGYENVTNLIKAGAKDIDLEGFDNKTGFGVPIIPVYFKEDPTNPEPEPEEGFQGSSWFYLGLVAIVVIIMIINLMQK